MQVVNTATVAWKKPPTIWENELSYVPRILIQTSECSLPTSEMISKLVCLLLRLKSNEGHASPGLFI